MIISYLSRSTKIITYLILTGLDDKSNKTVFFLHIANKLPIFLKLDTRLKWSHIFSYLQIFRGFWFVINNKLFEKIVFKENLRHGVQSIKISIPYKHKVAITSSSNFRLKQFKIFSVRVKDKIKKKKKNFYYQAIIINIAKSLVITSYYLPAKK